MSHRSLSHLSRKALLDRLQELLARDRRLTVEILEVLIEVDWRRLWAKAGYPSMYAWCMGALGFSEDVAAKRICAARQARQHPEILDMVADGRLHLSGLLVLAPKLREAPAHAGELLEASAGRSRRAIEALLSERFPQHDVPTRVTRICVASSQIVPAPGRVGTLQPGGANTACPGAPAPAPGQGAVEDSIFRAPASSPEAPAPERATTARPASRIAPLAPQRYAVQFTMDEAMHADLVRAQELLGPQTGDDRVRDLFRRALSELVAKLEKRKFAATDKPRESRSSSAKSRHVPADVRRSVRARDEDRCTFVAPDGHRCESREQLEFDHVLPVARGGRSTVENVRLLCRAHNQLEAERELGEGFMHDMRTRSRAAGPRADGVAFPNHALPVAPATA